MNARTLQRAALLFAYAAALLAAYALVVAPAFAYEGFRWVVPSLTGACLSLASIGGVGLLYPDTLDRPSNVVIAILALLVVIPVAVVIPCTEVVRGTAQWAPVLVTASWALVCGLRGRPVPSRSPLPSLPAPLFWTAVIVVTLLLVVGVAMDFGFRIEFLSFSDVYSVRSDFKGLRSDSTTLGKYGVNWLANVVAPLLLVTAIDRKRWFLAVPGVVLILWIYSITGFKATLLGALLVCLVTLLVRWQRRSALRLASVFLAVVGVSTAADFLLGTGLTSLAVRRMNLLPALLTGDYWDFFSSNPNAMLGHSILGPWVDYPYSADPPGLIGQAYFHSSTANANANLWADGFANFGAFGVLAAGLLLGLVLRLADRIAVGRSAALAGGLMTMPAVTLANSALLTTLLTGGLGLALVLLLAAGGESAPVRARRRERAAAPPELTEVRVS